MEKLYPAYAPHQNSVIGGSKQPQSPSTPHFALHIVPGGVEVSFSTTSAYTLKLTNISGREFRVFCGNPGYQQVLLQKADFPAGMYVLSLNSGRLSRSITLRIW
jgi:hypothetical protein